MLRIKDCNNEQGGKVWKCISAHKDIIFCALVCYILAHAQVLFHKIGYHDDLANFFGIGTTYASGRWALGLLRALYSRLFGDVMWSMPVFNGALVFILVTITACLLVDYFNVRSRGLRLVFAALFVIHPTVISLLGYSFTGPAYAFGVLCAVGSGLLLSICFDLIPVKTKCNPILLAVAAILLGAFSLGTYQSYISFTLMVLIYSLMRSTQRNTATKTIVNILKVMAAVLLIFVVYLVVWKVSLKITGIEPTQYKGIDQFGPASVLDYLLRIPQSYEMFFTLSDVLYPFSSQYIFTALVWIAAVAFPIVVFATPTIRNKVLLLLLYVCIPPAVNFSFLLVGTDLGALSLFGQVMLFAAVIAVIDAAQANEIYKKLAFRIFRTVIVTLVVCVGVFHIRYANQAASKGEYIQREYSSYFTTLVTRIQSTEGYTPKTPVLLVDVNKARGISIPKQMQIIDISPYGKENLVNYASSYTAKARLKMYLQQWCGFTAKYIDETSEIPNEIIESMPRYPSEGSIRVIDGILVVKF